MAPRDRSLSEPEEPVDPVHDEEEEDEEEEESEESPGIPPYALATNLEAELPAGRSSEDMKISRPLEKADLEEPPESKRMRRSQEAGLEHRGSENPEDEDQLMESRPSTPEDVSLVAKAAGPMPPLTGDELSVVVNMPPASVGVAEPQAEPLLKVKIQKCTGCSQSCNMDMVMESKINTSNTA